MINIIGFSIGMACCLAILLFIRDELSFDRYHSKGDRIYRVVTDRVARTPGALATLVREQLPDIEAVLRLRGTVGTWLFDTGNERHFEQRVYWADGSLFDVFDIPLLIGNPSDALTAPNTMVLSRSMARKYFGDSDPIGQVITGDERFPFTVTAIMEDPPDFAHFHPDFFVSIATQIARGDPQRTLTDWSSSRYYTYLLLPEGSSPDDISRMIQSVIDQHLDPEIRSSAFTHTYTIQPLFDIHLYSHLEFEMEPNGNVLFIWILTAIAVFILLIACMNFTNLAIVRSIIHAKEIGVRKAVGAKRNQVFIQFMGETFLLSTVAFLISAGVLSMVLPLFRSITGYTMSVPPLDLWSMLGGSGIVVLVSVISGGYPAFLLSRTKPDAVFRGGTVKAGVAMLRKVLVVAQFSIAIALIIGTGVVYQQLGYVQEKDLGFDENHVIIFPWVDGMDARLIYERFPQQSGVESLTNANYLPGRSAGRGQLPILPVQRSDTPQNRSISMQVVNCWGDYASTLGLNMVSGRDVTIENDVRQIRQSDGSYRSVVTACLLNEEAVSRLEWGSPQEAVGKFIQLEDQQLRVVGIVGDFHLRTLHDRIKPVIITLGEPGIFAIRLDPAVSSQTLQNLETLWKESTPHVPFSYSFLSDDVNLQYGSDRVFGQLVNMFAALAVFTACLGLYGLAVFTTRQRTREIGIRKVLGASVSQLVLLLSKEFTILVLIANIVAWPVAYLMMNRWLQNFAYHTDVAFLLFPSAGILGVLIALLTVSSQTLKAVGMNPVDSMRPGH